MSIQSFDMLMQRADDETLQDLVGYSIVRLLNALDPGLAKPSELRKIITQLHEPEVLLRDEKSRTRILQLLDADSARELARELSLDDTNSHASLSKMRVRKNSRREELLFNALGVIQVESEEQERKQHREEVDPGYGLFEHQRQACREVLRLIETQPRRALLHMPTGAGKTRTAMHVIASICNQEEPGIVVWLAYSEELCNQACEEFARAWGALGNRPIELYRHWGDHRIHIDEIRDGLVVAGLAKLYAGAKVDIDFLSRLGDRAQLVLIDEAHQAIAETYRFVLEHLVERDDRTALVGLTATPGRTWNDPKVDEELAKFFARQKVALKIEGYSNPVEYLIDNGYLARPNFVDLPYDSEMQLSESQLLELSAALDVPESILKRLELDEQRNLLIVYRAEALARRHKRIIIFAISVNHAKAIATVLRARGYDAVAVVGTTPRGERSRSIARFQSDSDKPMLICNYGVLTTGFDAPHTSAAIIARPTKSLVLYSQMVGRATRGPRAGGNETAEILTLVDSSLPGFGSISQAFTNWEDVWE